MNGSALLPSYRPQRWNSRGLTPVQERIFNAAAALLILAMVAGWVFSVIDIRTQPVRTVTVATPTGTQTVTVAPESASTRVTSALLDPRTRTNAYISDAALNFLDPVRGYSGKLKAAFRTPGTPLAGEAEGNVTALFESKGGDSVVSPDLAAPSVPGIYKIAVQIDQARRAVDDISLITLVPFNQKKGGRIGLYYLGSWPYEKGGTPRSKAYGNPIGFIEVTRENQNTYVSEHFRLRDFLTKDQPNEWPKYLLLDPKMLDKLELIIADLNGHGYNVKHMTVMSGFRTPRYNHSGGNTAGRANLSRHMYGDAADVYVDNDQDGWTDDVDKNGKVDIKDAEIVAAAAERVTSKYPALVGGIGIYSACCGHGPFVHVDIRGYAARWRGSGNG